MMRSKKDNEGPASLTQNQEENDSNTGVERVHFALKYQLNQADNETCSQTSQETVAFQVPRETYDSREDFVPDAVIFADKSSDDDCLSNDGILDTNSESSDTENQYQYKTVVITVTTIEPARSSRHKMTKRKKTTATMKILRRADASDEDIYFRIDGKNNIITNVEGFPEERNPRREESQMFPERHPSLDEALEEMRELEEVYEYDGAELHCDEHSAHESNEMDVFHDCHYHSDGNDLLFMDAFEDEDNTRVQMLDAGGSETESCDGAFEGTYDEVNDEARCNMDTSSTSYEEINVDLNDNEEENDSWERQDPQTLETFLEQEKSVDCPVEKEHNLRVTSVQRKSCDETKRKGNRSCEESCRDEEEKSRDGKRAREEGSRDDEEKSRDVKRARAETKHSENERSRSVEESCGTKTLDDEKRLEKVASAKVFEDAPKSHEHDDEKKQDSQQKHSANQVSEDPRLTRTDEKLANGHPLIEATSATMFEHVSKSHEQDVEKKQNFQQEEKAEDSLKHPKTPEIKETIEKAPCFARDPRLMSNKRRIALLSQAKQVKQGVTIVEPPFLPQGDRKAASSNVVSVNKSSPDEQSTSAANPWPAPISSIEFYGSSVTPQSHPFPRKFSEDDLARHKRREQNAIAREKWRRLVHSSANFVPTSRQSKCNLTPEQIQSIKSERREKLRKLAEQAKNPRMEEDSPSATVNSVPEASAMTESRIKSVTAEIASTIEKSMGKCVVAPSAEVTNETRACFRSSERFEQSPLAEQKGGIFKQTSRGNTHERGKENADTSNVEGDAIENDLVNEGGDCKSAIKNSGTEIAYQSSRIDRGLQKNAMVTPSIAQDSSGGAEFVDSDSEVIEVEEFEDTPRILLPFTGFDRTTKIVPDGRTNDKLLKLMKPILSWNPNWLKGRQKRSHDPPVVDETKLVKMLPTYQTHEEYCRIIEPLLLLELWHGILKDDGERKTMSNSYYWNASAIETYSGLRSWELYCHDMFGDPVVGDLVFFDYLPLCKGLHDHGTPYRTVFGYVKNVAKPKLQNTVLHSTFTVLTENAIGMVDPNCIKLRTASYIRSDMRTILALHRLKTSQLMNIILHPRIDDYRLPAATNLNDYSLVTKDSLNARQLEAVARVTKVVVQKLPKICLIAGPPGTGKSKVIVNLIMQLLCGEERFRRPNRIRILLCAPSNTAVDEVVVRLLNLRRNLEEKYRFSVARGGRAETMNPSVSRVSLRQLAKRQLAKAGVKNNESEGYYIAQLCRMEEQLLTEVDVIACTLTSCYTEQMELALSSQHGRIDVCIVDEATQCIEPETLIPLMLGIETLVLVGDTKQLPATVLSQKAKKLGLNKSLFARISQAFEHKPDSPIIQLNTQYRMSNPVALFPNKHFYSGSLINAAIMHKLPLYFYRVFNLNCTQNKDKFSNDNEAAFVANLMYALIARANYEGAKLPVTVGIITPYNNQKILLRKNIEKRIERLKTEGKIAYDVNTVDSFQGQERDIIIMSCVRSHGIGFLSDRQRLCVALTRAKHSLIICGNFKTFEQDPTWKALLDDANKRGVYINVDALSNTERITSLIIR